MKKIYKEFVIGVSLVILTCLLLFSFIMIYSGHALPITKNRYNLKIYTYHTSNGECNILRYTNSYGVIWYDIPKKLSGNRFNYMYLIDNLNDSTLTKINKQFPNIESIRNYKSKITTPKNIVL